MFFLGGWFRQSRGVFLRCFERYSKSNRNLIVSASRPRRGLLGGLRFRGEADKPVSAPRSPSMASRNQQNTHDKNPKAAQDSPRHTKMDRVWPQKRQDGPRWPPDDPKMAPRWLQDGSEMGQKGARKVPAGAQK